MTTTPIYWPGTTIVKSQHNAFHIALTRSAAPTPPKGKAATTTGATTP